MLREGNIFISSNKRYESGTTAMIDISNYNNQQSFSNTYLVLHPKRVEHSPFRSSLVHLNS